MSWTFTADSVKQTELSKSLTEASTTFDTKVGEMYTAIDSMGTSGSWVGEDYNLFKTGTEGYKTALGSARDSIKMFADHFTKLSTDTTNLANTLVTAIGNFLIAVDGISVQNTLSTSGLVSAGVQSAVAGAAATTTQAMTKAEVESRIASISNVGSNNPQYYIAPNATDASSFWYSNNTPESRDVQTKEIGLQKRLEKESDALSNYRDAVNRSDAIDDDAKDLIIALLDSEIEARKLILEGTSGTSSTGNDYVDKGLIAANSGSGKRRDDGVFFDIGTDMMYYTAGVINKAVNGFNDAVSNLKSFDEITTMLRDLGIIVQ